MQRIIREYIRLEEMKKDPEGPFEKAEELDPVALLRHEPLWKLGDVVPRQVEKIDISRPVFDPLL